MKNDRLATLFAHSPYETKVMLSLLEEAVGAGKVDKILDDLDQPNLVNEVLIEGRPLRFYSGLTDEQLTQVGLTSEGKKKLYEYFDAPEKPEQAPEETVEPKAPEPKGKDSEEELPKGKQVE